MAHLGRVLAALLLLAGCGGGDDGGGDAPGEPGGGDPDGTPGGGSPDGSGGGLVEDRPYELLVPEGYDDSRPTPLILLLHGYSSGGAAQLAYFGLAAVAEDRTILVAYPDGLANEQSLRYWNATNACCDFAASGVDDVAYLTAVVDDVAARYNVDPARVFAVGHSNGGFMSHRMACDRADRIAAIVSLAGAVWADPDRCQPSEPVAILQVHGDDDSVIQYEGGGFAGSYPSAAQTVATWADKNGCAGGLEEDVRVDLVGNLDGEETRVERARGCPGNASEVELWTMEGGSHVPRLNQPAWPEAIVQFLLDHARN